MTASLSHTKTHNFCSSLSLPRTNIPLIPSKTIQIRPILLGYRSLKLQKKPLQSGKYGGGGWLVVGCAKGGTTSVSELEKEWEEEMNSDDEEWMKWREKCKERKGIVELMECLEREAIMGEDEGREAGDYNRRAQIFDQSSKVFQAHKLKESNTQ